MKMTPRSLNSRWPLARLLALGTIALLLPACDDDTTAGAPTTPVSDPCQAASVHVAACLDSAPTATNGDPACDTAEAELILNTNCDELKAQLGDPVTDPGTDPGTDPTTDPPPDPPTEPVADPPHEPVTGYLAKLGCSQGLYHFCEVPACDAEGDEQPHVLSEEVPASASACAEAALAYEGCGACEYYRCREETAQCGADGYLMNFAHRYCNHFRLVSEPEASPEGQAWMNKIRRCLITSMDAENQTDDCQSIQKTGLATHPSCYVDTGFCDLPVSDWILVLNTIDPRDLSFREMFVTGNVCLKEWFGSD